MSKRPLKPDEKRAWSRVAKTVRPRKGQAPLEMPPIDGLTPLHTGSKQPASQATPPTPPNSPTFHLPSAPAKPHKAPAAPIQNRGKERRIRRGQAPISGTLDLHGHSQISAQNMLVSFLTSQRRNGASCVLVITGKGRRGEGVLRRGLLTWLGTGQARALVNGYAEAHRKHGGSGAWYLFLRKQADI